MESTEHLAVSYLAHIKHSQCKRVLATQFASPGQMVFGWSFKKRVDTGILVKPGHMIVYQIHETSSHVDGGHSAGCPLFKGERLRFNASTIESDSFNKTLAEKLTSSGLWKVEYRVLTECDVLHGAKLQRENAAGRVDSLLLEAPTGREELNQSLERLAGNSVLTCPAWLRRIRNGGCVSSDKVDSYVTQNKEEACGFVVLQGGRETVKDWAGMTTGFCLQKSQVSHEELGEGNFSLMKDRVRLKYKRRPGESESDYDSFVQGRAAYELDKMGENEYTMLRTRFAKTVCLHASQFRFLKQRRGLAGYRLLHYYHFKGMDWLKFRLRDLLKLRFKLKREESECGGGLASQSIKLQLNGFYGYCLLSRNTPPSKIFTESTLYKKGFPQGDYMNITTLGIVPRRTITKIVKGEECEIVREAEFLFMLNSPQEFTRSRNLVQIGSAILAHSKDLFLGHLEFLLNTLDPKKAELVYTDTDSMMFFISENCLPECVLPHRAKEFERGAREIFEDGRGIMGGRLAVSTPHSRLKIEGEFSWGFIRALKSYYLRPLKGKSRKDDWVKCKGLRETVQREMGPEHFEVGEAEERYYRSYCMKATTAKEVTIELQTRKQMTCLNMKRCFDAVGSGLYNERGYMTGDDA